MMPPQGEQKKDLGLEDGDGVVILPLGSNHVT